VTSRCEVEDSADPTTTGKPATELAAFAAGFVAAEGYFTKSANKFTFGVGLGATDAASCEWLKQYFDAGRVYWYPRRKTHYDDEATFAVQKMRDLVEVIVPFMDEHLPPSYKREQYEVWRVGLLDYWDNKAKRVRPCTVDGCERPRRAHGLCRHHLFKAGLG
jgi:hypothetical protein